MHVCKYSLETVDGTPTASIKQITGLGTVVATALFFQ